MDHAHDIRVALLYTLVDEALRALILPSVRDVEFSKVGRGGDQGWWGAGHEEGRIVGRVADEYVTKAVED